jgi:hypothetical protein
MHATSKWQEPTRDDELTLWEVQRKPRKLTDKNRRIRCALTTLNEDFRCVICLGYLKNTTLVMACLHRFCGECIHKCIRFGMKDCPSCRKAIPSRRSLKRDENFDMIVQKLVGSATEQQLDDDDVKGKQDANKMVHLQRAIQKKKHLVERQKQRSAELNRQQRSAELNKQQSSSSSSAPKAPLAAGMLPVKNIQPSPLLELELRRHPREDRVDRLERSFLTLRADAKVSLLKTFLSQKLSENDYEITSTFDDESVILDDNMNLIHAQETLCTEKERVMVLKYRLVEPPPDPVIAAEPEIPRELEVLEGFKAREARRALERGNDVQAMLKKTAAVYSDSEDDANAVMELGAIKKTAPTNLERDGYSDVEIHGVKAGIYLGTIKNTAAVYSDSDGESDVEIRGVTSPVNESYQEPDI